MSEEMTLSDDDLQFFRSFQAEQNAGVAWAGKNLNLKPLVVSQYAKQGHFMYELLQNAEDAGASETSFHLEKNRLIFTHNGTKIFTHTDIENICRIGFSQRDDNDHSTIGKFGIGFKAVYQFTDTPRIYSGPWKFQIRDFFYPDDEITELENFKVTAGETAFIIPFNTQSMSPAEAFASIASGFARMDETSLLFLQGIHSISFSTVDGAITKITRKPIAENKENLIEICKEGSASSYWLIWSSDCVIETKDEYGLKKDLVTKVSSAFRLKQRPEIVQSEKATVDLSHYEVIPVEKGVVSIFFPAESEDSGLKFHINAAFECILSRETLMDCPENIQLIDEIGQLIKRNIPTLLDYGLVSDSLFETLPNEEDDIDSKYVPIRDAIFQSFREYPLLTSRKGVKERSEALVTSSAQIQSVFTDADIQFTLKTSMDVTLKSQTILGKREVLPNLHSTRARQFLSDCGVTSLSGQDIIKALTYFAAAPVSDSLFGWLDGFTDERLRQFYGLLHTFNSGSNLKMRSVPFLRLMKNETNNSQYGSAKDSFIATLPDFISSKIISLNILNPFEPDVNNLEKEIREFFEQMQVREFDEQAQFEFDLKEFHESRQSGEGVSESDLGVALNKMQHYLSVFSRNSKVLNILKEYPVLVAEDLDGNLTWQTPDVLLIDAPFAKSGWRELLTSVLKPDDDDNPVALSRGLLVWGKYPNPPEFLSFLQALGALSTFNIVRSYHWLNPKKPRDGANVTPNSSARDYDIEDLDQILEFGGKEISVNLWNFLSSDLNYENTYAYFQANARSTLHTFESILVQKLQHGQWLVDVDGNWRTPSSMSEDELDSEFEMNLPPYVMNAIRFGEDVLSQTEVIKDIQDAVLKAGGSQEDSEFLNAYMNASPDEKEAMRLAAEAAQEDQRGPSSSPDNSGLDQQRRARNSRREGESEEVKRKAANRMVRQKNQLHQGRRRSFLLAVYDPEATGYMRCQLCERNKMPFGRGNPRSDFFMAVLAVKEYDFESDKNALAMCPNCSAMWKHAKDFDSKVFAETLLRQDVEVNDDKDFYYFEFSLANKSRTLRIAPKHLQDLQEVASRYLFNLEVDDGADSGDEMELDVEFD